MVYLNWYNYNRGLPCWVQWPPGTKRRYKMRGPWFYHHVTITTYKDTEETFQLNALLSVKRIKWNIIVDSTHKKNEMPNQRFVRQIGSGCYEQVQVFCAALCVWENSDPEKWEKDYIL